MLHTNVIFSFSARLGNRAMRGTVKSAWQKVDGVNPYSRSPSSAFGKPRPAGFAFFFGTPRAASPTGLYRTPRLLFPIPYSL